MPDRPASRLEAFDVLAPAGTTKAAPLEVATNFLPGELVRLEIIVPNGPNYLAGIRILLAHGQAIPQTAGGWIVTNDEKIDLEMAGYANSGAWSALVYNTDIYPHTFRLRYHVADFALTEPPAIVQARALPELA